YNIRVEQEVLELLPQEQIMAEAKRQLEKNPKAVFLIGGAKDVPYDEIIKALNMLRQAGVKSVGLMTQPL
ncbi:protein TolR, partial [Klebsiella oxytoca]